MVVKLPERISGTLEIPQEPNMTHEKGRHLRAAPIRFAFESDASLVPGPAVEDYGWVVVDGVVAPPAAGAVVAAPPVEDVVVLSIVPEVAAVS
jgi:hypothetical protein